MQPLQVNIKNTSAFDTEAVLQIRAVDENGEVLKEYPIGKLSANQSKELILSGEELNLYAQKADSCLYVNVVTEEEELYHADNYRYIFVELLKEDEDKKTDTSSTDTSRTSQDIMFPKEVSPQDISPTETNPQHINDKNIKRKLQKVTKIKLKKNKKKIVVSWKKQKKITGYQIMYATNKKFKKGKKRLVKKANYKFLIPKKGKYCYVKIRSYLKKGKKVQYSSWSKRKKIRIKK